ncbi:MAG: dihydrolipoyl dehydrogenase [Flavobacteriaceae bacterium]|jgi:dihydrolipoamide dehydrogenase|nr:dihydrolipoyl dehydrogenase [Flavobacteriaceae bacterium]MBT4112659.1 dihydrolipoyl dehydrogenase [Flavobacteriaceae bacterium]MBT4614512.1 dihydrolipoyl dehydrogenase [Flavobacteriaceae bacterium]MBT5246965.1 dihydrolipoyl dehydrogenase [Flavobacteriaceae bacterium]MBT5650149.1 dihydrolipoyl dehydrogenase [Flavobacteriaceae bacterium]
MESYDVLVIGSGPGGYVAAIRGSQLGMKTAIIEKYSTMGGTCLNVGCIPSKALLDSSHHYEDAIKKFPEHGIDIKGEINFDLSKMIARKQAVVDQTTKGIDFLMKKNDIKVFNGIGSFKDNNNVDLIVNGKVVETINSKNIIIATGSKPSKLPFAEIDKERIITSTEALSLKEVPKHLIVVGGGVIGLELGQVYSRLGAKVSIIEYQDRIISSMDSSLSKELAKVFKKQKMELLLSHKVSSIVRNGNLVNVLAYDKNEKEVSLQGDYCLIAIGRKPYTEGLNLKAVGLDVNERGQIEINENMQTKVESIYAIGDVVRGAMLAHKAEEEGILASEFISGQKPHIDYNLIPGVVYTWPEVASVGKTEEELKSNNVDYKIGQFPMRALGRSRASSDLDGFVKILADKKSDEILGIHMIGARCADLISEAVVAMEFKASAEDIARISHAHPTYSEAVKEAALSASENRPIHI